MTTIERPREIWNTMPGWGIAVNLTPPELLAARRLRMVRKVLIAALAAILLLSVLGYGAAAVQHGSASQDLANEQSRTAALVTQQHQYNGVVQLQGSIDQVQSRLGVLLGKDVDFSSLIAQIRSRMPAGMTISQLSMTIDTGTSTASSGGAAALDATGLSHIGTVTLSGGASHLRDASVFVDKLKTIHGVVQPYPASNAQTTSGIQYSVQLTLTNELLTHAYDKSRNGAK